MLAHIMNMLAVMVLVLLVAQMNVFLQLVVLRMPAGMLAIASSCSCMRRSNLDLLWGASSPG